MIKSNAYKIGLLIASSLILSACGERTLSRSAAEEPIRKWLDEQHSSSCSTTEELRLSYDPNWERYPNNFEPRGGLEIVLKEHPRLSQLLGEGLILPLKYAPYISITRDEELRGEVHWRARYVTSITEIGKPYFAGYVNYDMVGESRVYVKTSECALDSITGVSVPSNQEGNAYSIVTFRSIETLTPFGKALGMSVREPGNSTAQFQLFDDGWRLQGVLD